MRGKFGHDNEAVRIKEEKEQKEEEQKEEQEEEKEKESPRLCKWISPHLQCSRRRLARPLGSPSSQRQGSI